MTVYLAKAELQALDRISTRLKALHAIEEAKPDQDVDGCEPVPVCSCTLASDSRTFDAVLVQLETLATDATDEDEQGSPPDDDDGDVSVVDAVSQALVPLIERTVLEELSKVVDDAKQQLAAAAKTVCARRSKEAQK